MKGEVVKKTGRGPPDERQTFCFPDTWALYSIDIIRNWPLKVYNLEASMQSTAVKDHMSKIHLVFNPDVDVLKAIARLVEIKINAAPVVDDHGDIAGLLTERDCLAAALHSGYFGDPVGKVSDFMTKEVNLIEAGESILDVAGKAERAPTGRRHYLVLEENRLIGYVGHHEMLKALMVLRGMGR